MKEDKAKKWILIIAVIGILSILAEIVFPIHYHPYFWWHAVIGFDYVFGFLGGFALILLAKWVLFPLVKRDRDVYERGNDQ